MRTYYTTIDSLKPASDEEIDNRKKRGAGELKGTLKDGSGLVDTILAFVSA